MGNQIIVGRASAVCGCCQKETNQEVSMEKDSGDFAAFFFMTCEECKCVATFERSD